MSHSTPFGKWASRPQKGEEVVVSGISGRFPECHNVQDLQNNLLEKVDMITSGDRRWKFEHPEVPPRNGKTFDLDRLDAGFFGLHFRQADVMHPATRKVLEVAVEAVLDAGINPSELQGTKTGVFIGACYLDLEIETLKNITEPQSFGITGYLRSVIANRISYLLKLRGPSCIVDTACSSSLNALDLAFRCLRSGKCDNALVGGFNVLLHPGYTRQFTRLGVLSPEGVPKVFDQEANGYAKADAIPFVFLQKSKNAKRIYAQIVFSKANSDGFKPRGISFPSSQMQTRLMTESLEESGIEPGGMSYMEAHGTGTTVGDPEEVEAIYNAIASKRREPLLTGSVKCSVGHSESASGLGSLAKVIIAMESGLVPPNIHLENIKKGMLGFEVGKMKVAVEKTLLEGENPVAGINNFGFGGSNCHVLLRRVSEVKSEIDRGIDGIPRLVCVSGRNESSVLSWLENVRKNPLDYEYIGLMHGLFKKDVMGHLYRGFTIVSKDGSLKSDCKKVEGRAKSFRIVFGRFENGSEDLTRLLRQFPVYQTTINKVNGLSGLKSGDKCNPVVTQICLIEIFKLLELQPEAVYGVSVGKIASSYYNKQDPGTQILESKSQCNGFQDNHFRKDSLSFDHITKEKNSLLLNFSDEILTGNAISFSHNGGLKFLETLGRLYQEGFNPQLHKLYPPVQFPVSRGTPMLAPSIKWDYRRSWYTYRYEAGESPVDITQQEFTISPSMYDEHEYLLGHVIDGRNLLAATAYLHLVWRTFVQCYSLSESDRVSIVFENCRFVRAITLPKKGVLKLLVLIQKSSGSFEVVEKDTVVVSGRIYTPDDVNEHLSDLPPFEISAKRCEYLEQDEIYRELYLRGYNYSGVFKGITKSNVDASAALIQWEDNWVSFLDKMLQLTLLQMDTRLLYVPVGIRKIAINPLKHAVFAEKQPDALLPVYSYKTSNIVKSGEIEIRGLKASAIAKRRSPVTPVLEKYVFVPNDARLEAEDSARVVAQIVIENLLENNFKAVEIVDDFTAPNSDLMVAQVAKALDDLPSVVLNLKVSSKSPVDTSGLNIRVEDVTLTASSNFLLLVASGLSQRPSVFKQCLNALTPEGFLLTREALDVEVKTVANVEIVTQHVTNRERLILFRRRAQLGEVVSVEVGGEGWIAELQGAMQGKSQVLLYSQRGNSEGLAGFANCIRREPFGKRVQCFILDEACPKFNPSDLFYVQQIHKGLAFNVLQDKAWGTYRHLVLEELEEVESPHIFLNTSLKGSLSNIRWFQGALNANIKLKDDKVIIYPHFCGINFKDIMLASGRVSVDAATKERVKQDCPLGFEFSGKDAKGNRVFGMAANKATASMVVAAKSLVWEVPDSWSLEQASTVTVVYATVLFALSNVTIKHGMSILIHSATGGVGIAALHVCQYLQMEIFVTVSSEEKRQYLKKHFPQIPDDHIGNSRDLSFEEMIKTQTRGRGVDVVINSLAEDSLKATARCVADGGSFLEIGRFDMGNDSTLELYLLERNIGFHAVLLEYVMDGTTDMKTWMMEKFAEGIRLGYIRPLPSKVFEMGEAAEAFKYMATGTHIGKVVLKIRDESLVEEGMFRGYPRFECYAEKSYIVIGGLGGCGLELSDWLYVRGVKKLVLVSRSGVQNGYQQQRIKIWQNAGVAVKVLNKDLSKKSECQDLIREANELGPIDAIFNLAVILKDSLFENQTEENFTTCLAPKAQATIYLDELTRTLCPDLRYFVVFSSVSCGRGNPGQTNYGMANSIMEKICERRKSEGFPGLAIQWGAIGDVGLVAKMQKENKELVIGGTLQQKISSCLEVLDKFLNQNHPIVSSMVVAEKVDKSQSGSAVEAVGNILGVKNVKEVNAQATFAELGMDSMMVTEMIQILEKDFAIYLTAKEVRNLTFASLVELQESCAKTDGTTEKVDRTAVTFLRHLPDQLSDASLIRIKLENNGKTVFVLPGIEGVLTDLEQVVGNLRADVWGVQYSSKKPENSIEEIAKGILDKIVDTVKIEGAFRIVGYSFGVVVALELVLLLEQSGFQGVLVALDGSISYLQTIILNNMPLNDVGLEVAIVLRMLAMAFSLEVTDEHKEKLWKCKSFEERVEAGLCLVSSEAIDKHNVQKQIFFSLYKRMQSLVDYKIRNEKIKSRVSLFKASSPLVEMKSEDYDVSSLCEKPISVTKLEGDHSSILHNNQLINDLNFVLSL